jgi:L-threonylcarbamoyladenylate synthase
MKTIKINPNKVQKNDIKLIVTFLKKGKIIVYPTDTIYGLGCSATDKKAIAKIYRLKKREKKKPLLVLISDFKMLRRYFNVDKNQAVYLRKIWPGKVSVILNKKLTLPNIISAGLSSAAVRLPKSKFLTKMIRELGEPVVSTSLNLSGEKPLVKVNDLAGYFSKVAPVLAINAGVKRGRPSKLIDLRDVENIKILRK